MKNITEIVQTFDITESEFLTIRDVIENFTTDKSFSFIILYLKKIFGGTLSDGHIMAIGYIYGVTVATDTNAAIIKNQLSLCQRQN